MAWIQVLLVAMAAVSVRSQLDDAKRVSEANNDFSNKFYQILTKKTDGNLLYSPFSISSAIAMLQAGASGSTAKEIQSSMGFPDNDKLFRGYRALGEQLKSNENYTLETANSIFPKTGFQLKTDFSRILSESFRSEVKQLDFNKAVESAKEINGWVENKTHGKIQDLISADQLSQDTRIVLVNAIYFKGLWLNKFSKEQTHKADFHVSESEKVPVDMMMKEADFPYAELPSLDAKAVALPYKGGHLYMLIILPNQITGLKALEEKLKDVKIQDITSQLRSRKVTVYLPKFKISSSINLNEPLKELGLKSMYGDAANFDNIGNEPLKVSDAVHKAFIEVNEEGSEAAAATALQFVYKIRPISIRFKVDRPFLFAVTGEQSVTVFQGRVHMPLQN